ncbi:hypothetical protein F4779DRAFT_637304 [Xylariaceae sp. FL0662B]|nr:hypothetical protein F4779DRAFT_637304 [Xylariaceae sp. FL0662B]
MFGTLRFTPQSNGVDFIERADGKSFSEMGNSVPPHSACISCRSKKLRCGGQKPECDRCKTSSLTCIYAPVEGSTGRRRGGQKRNNRGGITQNPSINASPKARLSSSVASSEPDKAETVPAPCIVIAGDTSSSTSSSESPTINNRSTPISCMSGPKSNCSYDMSLDITPCLDPELLSDTSGTNFNLHSDGDFQFLDTDMTFIGTEKPMVNDVPIGVDTDIFKDIFTSVDSSLGMLWPTPPSTGAMSPNVRDATPPPIPNVSTSIMPSRHSLGPNTPSFGSQTDSQSNTSSKCAGQCIHTITLLIEELETLFHAMKPHKLEAVLSWQKKACDKCSSMLRCKTCYASPEQMMLLIMVCDKLIMLSRKLLWYALDASKSDCSLLVGEYEVEEHDERLAIIRHLSIYRVRSVAKLVADIKASPAVDGKQVQLMMLRNIEQQAERTINEVIKESLTVLTK